MNALWLNSAATAAGLEVSSGMPLILLVPFIMLVAIASVVGIMWLYKKLNKK